MCKMAEATPGPEQTGATAGDVDLELVLKTGEVTYKGKRHTLTVRQSGLELESADSKKTGRRLQLRTRAREREREKERERGTEGGGRRQRQQRGKDGWMEGERERG